MSRPVHFEIPAQDPERAKQFFSKVFGWQFQQAMPDYHFALTGEGMGIDGAIMKRPGPVTNSILVDSIDEYMTKVEQHGGTIVVPKTEIPGMGFYANFTDTEGNIHGLWQAEASGK
jgi:uncharacterized protein